MKGRVGPAVLILGVAFTVFPGCYEHVVGAKGYGASGTTTYEPNLKEPGKEQRTPIQRKPPKRMTSDGH